MSRPVPHWRFLTQLAQWVSKNLASQMEWPTLLAARPDVALALVAGRNDRGISVLDTKKKKIVRNLPMPRATRQATDFRRFVFDDAGMCVCGYDSLNKSFVAWSLADGNEIHESKGEGQISPSMCFLSGGRLAVCDGPKINTYASTGDLMFYTPISDDLRSIALFPKKSTKPTLVAIGVFRKGLGGHHIHSFVIESGQITGKEEGPYRNRPERSEDMKNITLHELYNVPGSTQRILIMAEEEHVEHKANNTSWEYDSAYKTRLVPMNPVNGSFYDQEVEINGRHCLQIEGDQLMLIDEMGRQRRVIPFPLRLENNDWRLD